MKITSLNLSVIILLFLAGNCTTAIAQSAQPFPDPTAMDTSVKPGDNFYLYVNGTWQKNTPLPADEVEIGSGLDVYNKAKERIHSILTNLSQTQNPPGSIEQKIGDFFQSVGWQCREFDRQRF